MRAGEFELVFLRLYKLDPTEWSREVFGILDSFFADVDEYCADEVVRAQVHGLDEETLRHRASETIEALRALTA
jgi:hypothetical protein